MFHDKNRENTYCSTLVLLIAYRWTLTLHNCSHCTSRPQYDRFTTPWECASRISLTCDTPGTSTETPACSSYQQPFYPNFEGVQSGLPHTMRQTRCCPLYTTLSGMSTLQLHDTYIVSDGSSPRPACDTVLPPARDCRYFRHNHGTPKTGQTSGKSAFRMSFWTFTTLIVVL